MAEAHKCDVVNCDKFGEGAPAGRFVLNGASKGLCQAHADHVVANLFPDLLPKPEPEAPASPAVDQPSAPAEAPAPQAPVAEAPVAPAQPAAEQPAQ